MTQYAWYSPALDVIVLQTFMEECYISFEWSPLDLHNMMTIATELGLDTDTFNPMQYAGAWYPLGEL